MEGQEQVHIIVRNVREVNLKETRRNTCEIHWQAESHHQKKLKSKEKVVCKCRS